jgi:hypothetical protein
LRTIDLKINDDLTVNAKIQQGKVIMIVLDGQQGKATMLEAVDHGFTSLETVNGHVKRIKFEEYERL